MHYFVTRVTFGSEQVRMLSIVLLLAVGLAAVAASPMPERIVGGSITTIGRYPMAVAMIFSQTSGPNFRQECGGCILNNRGILTAAHCVHGHPNTRWRSRVGSTAASSGGVVHNHNRVINHPSYNARTIDNDIAVVHIAGTFSFNNNVRAAQIAGANFNVRDNDVVWAIGWGRTSWGGPASEQLREVQIWVINQDVCRRAYAARNQPITDNMLCSGWWNVGGRDQCSGDSGGPLLHNNVVIGVCSFGHQCALPTFPGVNARVSRFTNWIRNNS